MTTKTISKSTNLLTDHNELIRFSGTNDRLSFSYLAGNDTVTAVGRNQSISMVRSNNNTVIDPSQGLKLSFGAPAFNEIVKGFQNDLTGHVYFATHVTFAPDHHGGTLASGFGISVDFEGFKNIAALQARSTVPV